MTSTPDPADIPAPESGAAAATGMGVGVARAVSTRRRRLRILHTLANRPKALAGAMVANLIGCAVAYHSLEGTDVVTATWMALVTGTTTGYGDVYPKTLPGRLLVAYLMASMWVLDRLASAQFVARLIADPDCFTHDEQEELLADADDARAAALRVEELVTALSGQVAALRCDVSALRTQPPVDTA